MKEEKPSRRAVVESFLKTLEGPSAPAERIYESKQRLRQLLESGAEEPRPAVETLPAEILRRRRKPWRPIAALSAAGALAVAIAAYRVYVPSPWTAPLPANANRGEIIASTGEGRFLWSDERGAHVANSGLQIRPQQTIKTGQTGGGEIALSDGSRVELSGNVAVRFDREDNGIRIELDRGSIIVTAAKQRGGRLSVETKHLTLSVIGTVFTVQTDASGSRVWVLEGEVLVQQGTEARVLRPGHRMSAGAAATSLPLNPEIEWSRNAPALIAMAAALAPLPPPARQTQPQAGALGAASLEGIVVRKGTNEPIADAELELSRVEGTSAAPLAPGVAEMFASILHSTSYGLPAQGSTPPSLLAPEVKYGRTGNDGRFVFRDLKEGKYRLVAVRSGGAFYPAEYGQRDLTQRGLNFPIGAGEAKKDIQIEMTPTGAISGRVVDEDGQPMGHVVVMALTATERAGQASAEIERVVLTDENGEYRLFWLGPGKYYVAAVYEDPQRRTIELAPQGPPARTITRERATSPVVIRRLFPDGSSVEEAYGVVYFGGTVDLGSARAVAVYSGETFGGADIPMGAGKTRTHHIRGAVLNGDTGQPAGGVSVLAIPRQRRPNALVLRGTSNPDGTFDLVGAFPEAYVLTATGMQPPLVPNSPGAPQNGYVTIEPNSNDVDGVRIVMRGGTNLAGRVTIEGRSPGDSDPDLSRMIVRLTRDPDLLAMPEALLTGPPEVVSVRPGIPPQRPSPGQVAGNGDFTLVVSQGDFRVSVTGVPSNMYVKSILMGAQDLMRSPLRVSGAVDRPLQITIGTDGGTASGSVVDERSRPFTNATVVLIPDGMDRRTRPELYRNTTTDSEGNFRLAAIPPGDYKLFAWEWAQPDSWKNPDFIRAYENAGRVLRVSASSSQERVQLNVIPIRR